MAIHDHDPQIESGKEDRRSHLEDNLQHDLVDGVVDGVQEGKVIVFVVDEETGVGQQAATETCAEHAGQVDDEGEKEDEGDDETGLTHHGARLAGVADGDVTFDSQREKHHHADTWEEHTGNKSDY